MSQPTGELAMLGALLEAFPGAAALDTIDAGSAAVEYAVAGWEVFPLDGKFPLLGCPITRAHKRAGRAERCRGDCGHDGHGVLDGTRDVAKVAAWWTRYPNANIGARVPVELFVLDIDPRHDGDRNLADLEH